MSSSKEDKSHPLAWLVNQKKSFDKNVGKQLVSRINKALVEENSPNKRVVADLVNQPLDDLGRTALHLVQLWDYHSEGAKYLLKLGARLDVQDKNGRTPLSLACSNPLCFKMVQILLDAKGGNAVVDIPDQLHGKTPLHYASNNIENAESVVQRLLKAGANVKALDKTGSCPLHYVRHVQVAQALLQDSCDDDDDDNEARAKLLNFPLNNEGDTPLHSCLFRYSVHNNYEEEDDEDDDDEEYGEGKNPVLLDHPQMAAFWVEQGADVLRPNKKGHRPVDCIKMALKAEVVYGCIGSVSTGLTQIIDFLMDVLPVLVKSLGNNPAATADDKKMLDASTIGGKMLVRVMDEFVGDCSEDIMEHIAPLLSVLGANVNYANPKKKNFTVLHMLLSPQDQENPFEDEEHIEDQGGMQDYVLNMMDEILDAAHGRRRQEPFDFSAADSTPQGRTLLHLACEQGYDKIAARLVELAPELLEKRTVGDDGKTPLQVAKSLQETSEDHAATVQALLKLGAKDASSTAAATTTTTAAAATTKTKSTRVEAGRPAKRAKS